MATVTNNGINKTCDTFTVSTGIFLPTTGGTATILDFNEAGTLTRTWSGIWASPQNGDIIYSRVGKTVTLTIQLGNAAANTATTISLVTALPTELRPTATVYKPIIVEDNGVGLNGTINITSAGAITIAASANGASFSGTSLVGNSGLFANYSTSYAVS